MDKAVQEGRFHVFVFEGGSRCFAPGTLVVMEGGARKPIERVEYGDVVKCLDGDGNIVYRRVVNVWRHLVDKPVVEVKMADGGVLRCSSDHKFFVGGEYQPIINLLYEGELDGVESWSFIHDVRELFDLHVDGWDGEGKWTASHNYFISVGEHEFNVHNSSKTYSLIQWFIVYALTERRPTRVVISRKKGTWLNATVWVDFCNILIELGLREGIDYRRNKTLHQIAINNTTFEFIGLDDVQKLHGLTVDIFWINEAMEASKDDFDQLEQRTSRFAVLDYNPSAEQHWIYDTVCTRDDCYFDHSTMLQNPFIPENSRRKILSYEPTEENFAQGTADERKWKIYGLGMRAALEGLIFNNIEYIDQIPESIDKRAYGLDFGYSSDPSACIELGYFQNNLYIDEKFYKAGMLTREIISELAALQQKRRLPIISESADPRLVDEIKQSGLPIYPVHKYAGSIEAGIDFMRGCKIYVTNRSLNVKKELENYTYAQDRYGNWLNVPVDDWNHALDCARYICLELIIGQNKRPVDLQKAARAIGR